MNSEKWKVNNEQLKMNSEKWKVNNEHLKMTNEHWKVKSEKWKMEIKVLETQFFIYHLSFFISPIGYHF